MQKDFYFLSPVEVVKVTPENLEELATWCGGSVQTETKGDKIESFVKVPTPESAKISDAYPGMFVTKRLVITMKNDLRGTFAVFRRDYFEKNYFAEVKLAVDKTWEREERERQKRAKRKNKQRGGPHLTTNVGDALKKAQDRVKELEAALDKVAAEVKPIPMPLPPLKVVEVDKIDRTVVLAGTDVSFKVPVGLVHNLETDEIDLTRVEQHEDLSQQSPGEDEDDAITG